MRSFKLFLIAVLGLLAFATPANATPEVSWEKGPTIGLLSPTAISVEASEASEWSLGLMAAGQKCPGRGSELEWRWNEGRPESFSANQKQTYELPSASEYTICVEDSGTYWETSTGQLKAEGAREAREEAEATAKREAALHQPLRTLKVHTRAYPGHSSYSPGYTDLVGIVSPEYAFVEVKLSRYGHRTERYEIGGGEINQTVNWSCARPGGVYHYTVTAWTLVGQKVTRKGTFKPVSGARCRALKRYEQEARERSQRQYEAQVRHEREAEQERINRFKENCRKANGTPRLFYEEEGNYWRCVAPGGGFLSVPT